MSEELELKHERCDRCRVEITRATTVPILDDETWRQLCDHESELLCWNCMRQRAHERLGRALRFSELEKCLANWDYVSTTNGEIEQIFNLNTKGTG